MYFRTHVLSDSQSGRKSDSEACLQNRVLRIAAGASSVERLRETMKGQAGMPRQAGRQVRLSCAFHYF